MNLIDSKTEDEVKARLDALRFLSETHRTVRDQRRGAQLQSFFTTVTFYALIGAGKFTGKLQLPNEHQRLFVVGTWCMIIAVAILSSVHLLGLQAANRVNRHLAQSAEDAIRKMCGIPGPKDAGRTIAKTYFWEIAMIGVFALAAGISVTLL